MTLNRIIGYTLLILPITGLIGYGAFVEPNQLEVTKYTMGKPATQTNIRIVQISDLHLQAMDDIRKLVARRAVEAKPDVIVLSGDIIDKNDSLPALDTFLSELGAIQKVAVLGNWEYWSEVNLKDLTALYARHQTELLINDCHVLQIENRKLAFIGLDDALAGKPKVNKALKQCPDVEDKILIEHSPGFFGKPLDTPAVSAPYLLSLSGHTHGGQIAFFGTPIESPPGSGEYNSGWYETKYGKLYVSRGIGTTVVPLRIGVEPELPVFEVRLP
jgi:predicted MPP superfamily phosphohydrolase